MVAFKSLFCIQESHFNTRSNKKATRMALVRCADHFCMVQALRGKAESIRAGELDKAMGKMGEGLTKKQLKAIEELSRSIVNKILHGPMTALRCDGSDPDAVGQTLANMEALERMFELSRFNTTTMQR